MLDFKLRPWNIDDLDSLVKYANNPNIGSNLSDGFPYPYTKESGLAFIEKAISQDPVNIMAIEIRGEASGGIGIHRQTDIFSMNAELGYWLAQTYWGNGIMTNAIIEMIKYGFEKFDIQRIFARPFGRNIGSQRVLEKAGFKLEAKFEKTIYKNGQYEDEWVYAVRRSN